MMQQLNANAVDFAVVGTGDSIAATTATSYYEKWWALLAPQWTQWTFKVAKWNDGLGSYDAPTTIQTGLGARTCTFYNASVTGTLAHYLLIDKRTAAITAPAPILIFCNYGANHAVTQTVFPTRYFSDWVGSIRELLPTAQIAIVGQPPNRDGDDQVRDMTAAKTVAALAGVAYIPIYEKILSDGKPAGYYADAVHLSSAGGDVGAAVINQYSVLKSGLSGLATPAFFVARGDTLAFNKLPGQWTGVNATVSNTTVAGEFETGGSALKVVNTTTATDAYVFRTIASGAGINPYKGNTYTYLVRKRAFVGSSVKTGRTLVYVGSLTETASDSDNQFGTNFYWQSVTINVPTDATELTVYVYASLIAFSGTVCVDRAYLVPGNIPGF
jgi:hypothetical protein